MSDAVQDLHRPKLTQGLEVLRAEVGSGLHGTGLPGQEDRDEMGVCVEHPEYVTGLGKFEQYVYRTQPEGSRSGPGDLDLTIYSLRKYVRLAAQGNPSVLLLLYVPMSHVVTMTPIGEALQALAPSIVSRQAGHRYLGYMNAQRERLLGLRGGGHGRRGGGQRPELIEEHGFDTKFAMHMARLTIQGRELLSTGKLTLPVPKEDGDWLRAVRRGEIPLADVLARVAEDEKRLRWLTEGSAHIRDVPDWHKINTFLHGVYLETWESSAR